MTDHQKALLAEVRRIAALPDAEALAELAELFADTRSGGIEAAIARITGSITTAYAVERAGRQLRALQPENPQDRYRIEAAMRYAATARARRKYAQYRIKQDAGYFKVAGRLWLEAKGMLRKDWAEVYGGNAPPVPDIAEMG